MDLILFILYSCAEGYREGSVFSYGTAHFIKTNYPQNIHIPFFVHRLFVGLVFAFLSFLIINGQPGGLIDLAFRVLSFALIFSFFRDGAYNITRKALEPNSTDLPYTLIEAWTYTSSTSTAKFNFKFWVRGLLFLIGIGVYYYTLTEGIVL